MLARLGTNRKQFDFRAGQRETWRERGGCWQSSSGKRNLYTSLLTNSSAPMLSSAFLSSRLISARGDESSLSLPLPHDYSIIARATPRVNIEISWFSSHSAIRTSPPFLSSYLPFPFSPLCLRYSVEVDWWKLSFFPNEFSSRRRRNFTNNSWTNRKSPYRFLSILPLNFLKSSRNLKRKRFEFRSELKPR